MSASYIPKLDLSEPIQSGTINDCWAATPYPLTHADSETNVNNISSE